MKNLKNKSKKAQTAIFPVDMASVYLFIIGVTIILILFSLRSCGLNDNTREILNTNIEQTDNNYILQNLLRTPLNQDNFNELTVAELIVLWNSDKSYESNLKKQVESILHFSKKNQEGCMVLCIDEKQFYNQDDCQTHLTACVDSPLQEIPNFNGQPIKITLNSNPREIDVLKGGTAP